MANDLSGQPRRSAAQPPTWQRLLGLVLAAAAAGLAAVAIIAVLFAPRGGGVSFREHRAVGRKLPALKVVPLVGPEQPLELGDLQGQVVLVNFWGTWCPPCVEEFPHIAALHHELGSRPGFRVLSISCSPNPPSTRYEDVEELRTETAAFLQGAKLTLPVYADPDFTTRSAFDSVGRLRAYPTSFVIDGEGLIHGVWQGFGDTVPEEMKSVVLELLAVAAGEQG